MEHPAARAGGLLAAVRRRAPLVHAITNFVSAPLTANALLALGAAPVMAHAVEEVEEMAGRADALVLNLGTPGPATLEAMRLASRRAAARGIPVVLDPVGAGATAFRSRAARRLLAESRPRAVRGNASEILALVDSGGARGVDAQNEVEEACAAAQRLAGGGISVVAVTGAVDFVTDGRRAVRVGNGHPLLARVTGTGCVATALVAAFLAVEADALLAAAAALACLGVAGEQAAAKAHGPGTFAAFLLDALHGLGPEEIAGRARLTLSPAAGGPP